MALGDKSSAIQNVLDKDDADKVTIQADWTAATAAIKKSAAYLATLKAFNAAKADLHKFQGTVEHDSGAADESGTPDVQENKKTVHLTTHELTLPAVGEAQPVVVRGTVALAQRRVDVAKTEAQAATTALTDATNTLAHWKEELTREGAKLTDKVDGLVTTPGLTSLTATAKLALTNKAAAIKVNSDDLATKVGLSNAAAALDTASLARVVKLKAVGAAWTTELAKPAVKDADPGAVGFTTTQDAYIVAAKASKVKFDAWVSAFTGNASPSIAATGYTAAGGENLACKAGTGAVQTGDAGASLALCAAACSALPIVTFSTTQWDSTKTAAIATEWNGVYDPTTVTAVISNKKFGAGTDKTYCLGL